MFYAVLVLFGAARGFAGPSGQSLLPFLVPQERLPRAISTNSSAFTGAIIAGPALGGFSCLRSGTGLFACIADLPSPQIHWLPHVMHAEIAGE